MKHDLIILQAHNHAELQEDNVLSSSTPAFPVLAVLAGLPSPHSQPATRQLALAQSMAIFTVMYACCPAHTTPCR